MTNGHVGSAIHHKSEARRLVIPAGPSSQRLNAAGRRAGYRDALLGAGLVACLPLVVLCTFWLLPSSGSIVVRTLLIELGASLLAFSLLFLPWPRLPAALLVVFPGILAATLISTATLDRTITASYIGFLTVSFIYIGITQSRLIPVLAVPVAIPISLL